MCLKSSKTHKLDIVSAAPVACMVCLWLGYDNEIEGAGDVSDAAAALFQPVRQLHFRGAGMRSGPGSYITARAGVHRRYGPDLWIRCVRLYTPSGTELVWFCAGTIKQATMGLANCNMMNNDEIVKIFFFEGRWFLIWRQKRNMEMCSCQREGKSNCKVLHLFLIFASAAVNSKHQTVKFLSDCSSVLEYSGAKTLFYSFFSRLFFFVFITAASGISCQQKHVWWSSGKTTLSQADLELGCISFSPHSASASLSGLYQSEMTTEGDTERSRSSAAWKCHWAGADRMPHGERGGEMTKQQPKVLQISLSLSLTHANVHSLIPLHPLVSLFTPSSLTQTQSLVSGFVASLIALFKYHHWLSLSVGRTADKHPFFGIWDITLGLNEHFSLPFNKLLPDWSEN